MATRTAGCHRDRGPYLYSGSHAREAISIRSSGAGTSCHTTVCSRRHRAQMYLPCIGHMALVCILLHHHPAIRFNISTFHEETLLEYRILLDFSLVSNV